MAAIMDVLQWIIPSGAIASVVTWLVNRSLHTARSAKEQQDIYKTMYENLHETVLNIQHENQKLNIAFVQLEKAISKAVLCRHYDSYCPVRDELQNNKGKRTTKPVGHAADKRGKDHLPRSGTAEPGSNDEDAAEPPNAPGGGGIQLQVRAG